MQDWSDKLAEFDMLEQGLRQRQGEQVGKHLSGYYTLVFSVIT